MKNIFLAALLAVFVSSAAAQSPQSYALIDNTGKVQNVIMWDGKSQYSPPDGLTSVLTSEAGPGWTYTGGSFAPPIVTMDSPNYNQLAQAALSESDKTILNCVANAVPVPAEWVVYRRALQVIVDGGPGPLPTMPPYPAGT